MARYYFHFRDSTILRDDDGEDLPNAEAAVQHALRMAAELEEDLAESQGVIVVSDGQLTVGEVTLSGIIYLPGATKPLN